MKIRRINKLVVAIVALAFANAATAEVITFNSLVGSWVNVLPVSGVTVSGNGTGSPSLRWGTDAGSGQSGYDFVAETTPFDQIIPPSPSPDFDLGTFTHLNNPIFPPSLASATLRLDADISVDLVNIGIVSFFFDFIHNETTNNLDPCPNGESNGSGVNINGCADIVSIVLNDLSETFVVGGSNYTLNIVGFRTGGEALVEEFQTIEGRDNTATIVANLAIARSVPEPGTLALLGLGLVGMGLVRRRRVA